MADKPPLPARMFDPWPLIPIDDSRGTAADTVIDRAISAATGWVLGPDGPYKNPDMPLAGTIHGAVREGLLHLLELGLIDIDSNRIRDAKGFPVHRERPS